MYLSMFLELAFLCYLESDFPAGTTGIKRLRHFNLYNCLHGINAGGMCNVALCLKRNINANMYYFAL